MARPAAAAVLGLAVAACSGASDRAPAVRPPPGPAAAPSPAGREPEPIVLMPTHAKQVVAPFRLNTGSGASITAERPGGTAVFVFSPEAGGDYRVWLEVAWLPRGVPGATVRVDGGPAHALGGEPDETLRWLPATPALRLAAGMHPVEVTGGPPGLRIGRVALLPAGMDASAIPRVGTILPRGAVIVDNEDKDGRFQAGPEWRESPAGGDYGNTCHWTTPDPEGKAKLTWTAALPKAGSWRVYVWHGENPVNDHAADAPFTVEYDGGSQTIRVDESRGLSTWKLLGTFPFSPAKPARVVLANNASMNVIGDAVMFAPQ